MIRLTWGAPLKGCRQWMRQSLRRRRGPFKRYRFASNNQPRSQYKTKREILDFHSLRVDWFMSSRLFGDFHHPEIDAWTGELKVANKRKPIGQIHMHKINANVGEEVLEDISAEITALSDIFDKHGKLKSGVKNEVMGEISFWLPKLYINELEVDQEYKGFGLGLFLLDHACCKINDNKGLTLLCPATYREGVAPVVAEAKLRNYYGLLGFRPLGDCLIARWEGQKHRGLKEVCPHLFESNRPGKDRPK